MSETATYIGRYRIVRQIGQGTVAKTYEAYDERFGRAVTIKLWPHVTTRDDGFRLRFGREVDLIARLEHPAIVPVYDFGDEEGQPFLVMRLMTGGDMKKRLQSGPLSPSEASSALQRLSAALDSIHQVGLVHRNIKPSNILLDQYGTVYLSDFGIALPTQALTSTGVQGTPDYMSTEEVRGERVDAHTDVYQLGIVLFEMLTGQRPYKGDTAMSIFLQHIQDPIPSLRDANPSLSPLYDEVILKALAKNPVDRYASAGEMARKFSALVNAASQAVIVEPVANPFVVGNPVAGNLFVGRTEIFTRLQELWGNDASHNVNSVVLFGHRRMGKTSILQNLHRYFGGETVVAGLTMQRVGRVSNTGELLSYLALALFDALEDAGFAALTEPDPITYQPNGYPTFNRFLRDVRQIVMAFHHQAKPAEKRGLFRRLRGEPTPSAPPTNLSPGRIILTIDEFELIEEAIADGRVDTQFLDFLRGVIHSEPWLILALAGLHTLEEMTADYWNPLFASVTPVRVSFFSRSATGNLLAGPGENFPLTFTNAAADRIFELVQGQPYLTQLIAHSLVSQYNQAIFERGQIRSSEFTPQDVNQVIESRAFYDQGSYYFNGVWGQAEKSDPTGQIPIMRTLAAKGTHLSATELLTLTGLDKTSLQASLRILQQHDVVKKLGDGRFDFAVPLMRRWIEDVKL
ncbi:MAG: serine/threonine protein kinase [Anaerolineae bacterium]|nr:serine/threonine protein kinase [Anaerolineae bacterium]